VRHKRRLREQKKADKLQRIRSAAAGLFTELGYESATMRTIASRARVGVGTLFLYARDKRDLVFLIFNEKLDDILERAFSSANPGMPFLEQLVCVFSTFYAEFSKNAPLSRILLKELTFLSEGIHSEHFQERRRTMMRKIEALVSAAQANGSIRSHENPAFIAHHIFFIFAGALRSWIAGEKLELAAGVAELRAHFKLHLVGLHPAPVGDVLASRTCTTVSQAERR
jgi:TetR/AcrR family transcriptional regulator